VPLFFLSHCLPYPNTPHTLHDCFYIYPVHALTSARLLLPSRVLGPGIDWLFFFPIVRFGDPPVFCWRYLVASSIFFFFPFDLTSFSNAQPKFFSPKYGEERLCPPFPLGRRVLLPYTWSQSPCARITPQEAVFFWRFPADAFSLSLPVLSQQFHPLSYARVYQLLDVPQFFM